MMLSTQISADWRAEANQRIEQHRKGDLRLTLKNEEGNLLEDAELSLKQTRHAFWFGSCINASIIDQKSMAAQRYREVFEKYFSVLVAENAMKWYALEAEQGPHQFAKADAVLRFAEQNNLALRGHCLLWSKERWQQDWVKALNAEELRAALSEHFKRTLPYFDGKVVAWDMNNEMLDGDFYQQKLGDRIRSDLFKEAASLDPDVPLYLNEYSILNQPERVEAYLNLKKELEAQGAKVGGFGIQEHAAERILWDTSDEGRVERKGTPSLHPRGVWRSLDELGKTGLPIHITEISFAAENAEKRAEALDAFYRCMFAHPDVEALLLWGFWNRSHWMGKKAALFEGPEMKANAAGEKLIHLLTQEWNTREQRRSSEAAEFEFRGFYGQYEISVTHEGQRYHGSFALEKGQTELVLTLSRRVD